MLNCIKACNKGQFIFRENGAPLSKVPIIFSRNNHTIFNEITNQDGEVLVKFPFVKKLEIIEDPNPGGPYLINENNFEIPIVVEYMGQKTVFYFNSSAPIIIDVNMDDMVMDDGKSIIPFIYLPYGLFLSVILMIIYRRINMNKENGV